MAIKLVSSDKYQFAILSLCLLATFQLGTCLDQNFPDGSDSDVASQCNISLEQVTCYKNGTLRRRAGYWIGMDEQGNYFQMPCFLHYCYNELTVLNLSDPDSQCRDNHAGIMCGGCREGYSRMIGTFACGECDSYWNLLYILLFAVLGILVFVFLTVFNVTIKDGIFNGFIFYANIMYIYLAFHFSASSYIIKATLVPEVILSILNLRFNIPLCFYPGMEELHLAVWRFVFPLYLMVLLVIVILCGKYISNRTISKFFQKLNVIQVFSTVFLMFYTIIIQLCVVNFFTISLENSTDPLRWFLDANIHYNNPLHIFMVCFSIIILILLLPLSFLLLFPKIVFRTPKLRNLKPIIDAFIGPLASNREYWIGFRMLFRLVLFFMSLFISSDQIIHLLYSVFVTILTVIEVKVQPFNCPKANFVNNILLINLSLFFMSSILFTSANDKRAGNFMIFNLYVFLVMFLLFNIYYFYHFLLRFKSIRRLKEKIKSIRHLKKKIITCCKQRPRAISQRRKHKRGIQETSYTNSFPRVQETTNPILIRKNFIQFREVLLDTGSNSR